MKKQYAFDVMSNQQCAQDGCDKKIKKRFEGTNTICVIRVIEKKKRPEDMKSIKIQETKELRLDCQ